MSLAEDVNNILHGLKMSSGAQATRSTSASLVVILSQYVHIYSITADRILRGSCHAWWILMGNSYKFIVVWKSCNI